MERNNDNNRNSTKPLGFRDAQRGKFKDDAAAPNNRRALRDIKNFVNAPHPQTAALGKRGLPDRNVPDDKKTAAALVAHRPVTRRFAATLKSQSGVQELDRGKENPRRSAVGNSSGNCMDTSIDIDLEDDKLIEDLPLPMVEEVEEAMCEFREVEMEDLVTEPLPDIDSCDCDNPLAVVEYVEEIYSFHKKMEAFGCVSSDYMSKQADINEKMRAILVDWLIEVHYKFELMDETLYLTINIIDRFLAQQVIVRKRLQLVGVTAMLLACKYEEVSVPVVDDLILISDRAYTREDVLGMEKLIVNTLNFNMSVPTPYVFMRRYLKAADCDKKMELLSYFIIELCLVEYKMLKYQPSLLAAAAIYTARTTLNGLGSWTKTSELHTSYREDQLLECSKLMVEFHQKSGCGKLTGVHRKYNTYRFEFVAKCEPATFLLMNTRSP